MPTECKVQSSPLNRYPGPYLYYPKEDKSTTAPSYAVRFQASSLSRGGNQRYSASASETRYP
jgi:hypothetical protein